MARWARGKTRAECEANIAWMRAHRSPWCAALARRELDRTSTASD
jgi:hypothetical protein